MEIKKDYSYLYQSINWRAQALKVVDGDTADLFVDVGYHHYGMFRFRFLDIDTPELNSRDPEERERAKEAKELVQKMLARVEKTDLVNLSHWPLRIESAKDPDNFGRWLCRIFFMSEDSATGGATEISVNAELLSRGLAVPYEK